MRVLVTGARGQLGSELKLLSEDISSSIFFFTDVDELDITNYDMITDYLHVNAIDVVINCAAYTAVDKAESDINIARLINATAVGHVVKACEQCGCKLVHVSTDYVFNGEYFAPISEEMEVNPIGVYGITKREGEEFVINSDIEGIVIRTSWLYSSHGNNFVKTMLRLGKEKDQLGIIADQVGTPTYAADLANTILQIIHSGKKLDGQGKVYHYSNDGVASWYDFAFAIMELANIECLVKSIETKDYPTPAQRPHYSVMNKAKIKKDFQIEIPYWRESLKHCIKVILS